MLKSIAVLASALAVVATFAAHAHAQTSAPVKPGFELIVPSGTVVPTGAQRDEMRQGRVTAVQLSHGLRPDLVLTGTVGWARTRPVGLGDDARLDLLTYDAGVEYRLPRRHGDGRFNAKPFTGIGLGARTHNYRHVDLATTHNVAAYVSAGGEVALARVRLRLEVRDYLTWLNGPDAADATRRNDIVVMAGLRLGLR